MLSIAYLITSGFVQFLHIYDYRYICRCYVVAYCKLHAELTWYNAYDLTCFDLLDMVAHWLRRLLSTGGSRVRLPLQPPCRDLGQLPVRFGVKLRYSIRAVVWSASE